MTTRYALFRDGKQVTKSHSTKRAVGIEAIEKHHASYAKGRIICDKGYEIREVSEDE